MACNSHRLETGLFVSATAPTAILQKDFVTAKGVVAVAGQAVYRLL